MHDDTQMTITERRKQIGLMRGRYLLADRAGRLTPALLPTAHLLAHHGDG